MVIVTENDVCVGLREQQQADRNTPDLVTENHVRVDF